MPGVLEDVSFRLHRGEILGLAGLVGSGRSVLLRFLAGADSDGTGRLFVRGHEQPWPRTVRRALTYGDRVGAGGAQVAGTRTFTKCCGERLLDRDAQGRVRARFA